MLVEDAEEIGEDRTGAALERALDGGGLVVLVDRGAAEEQFQPGVFLENAVDQRIEVIEDLAGGVLLLGGLVQRLGVDAAHLAGLVVEDGLVPNGRRFGGHALALVMSVTRDWAEALNSSSASSSKARWSSSLRFFLTALAEISVASCAALLQISCRAWSLVMVTSR